MWLEAAIKFKKGSPTCLFVVLALSPKMSVNQKLRNDGSVQWLSRYKVPLFRRSRA